MARRGSRPDLVPGQGLRQRRPTVRLGDSQVVEDQPVLADGAVRFQDRALAVVRYETHLAAPAVHLGRHRGCQAHRILDGRVLSLAEVDVAVEIEQDPEVGRQRLLEGFRHETAVARGQRPVDAPEAVPSGVVAHAAGLRWVVGPRPEALRAADLLGARGHEIGDRPHTGIHQHRGALRQLQLLLEEAERLSQAQRGRPERHPAAAAVDAARLPAHQLSADRDDAPGLVVGDLAQVADLDPRRRHPARAAHLDGLLESLADGRRARVEATCERHPAYRDPRPGPRDQEQQAERVREGVGRADRGQVREEEQDAERTGESDLAHGTTRVLGG